MVTRGDDVNIHRLFAIIDRRSDELKAEILAEAEREPGGVAGGTPWCTIAEYAAWAGGVHPETVRRWIMDGMPAADTKKGSNGKVTGTRRTSRINRDEADAWRRSR